MVYGWMPLSRNYNVNNGWVVPEPPSEPSVIWRFVQLEINSSHNYATDPKMVAVSCSRRH